MPGDTHGLGMPSVSHCSSGVEKFALVDELGKISMPQGENNFNQLISNKRKRMVEEATIHLSVLSLHHTLLQNPDKEIPNDLKEQETACHEELQSASRNTKPFTRASQNSEHGELGGAA
ncbi:hypothetical protein NDU88_007679 [Pleurodeles waltl]|uniref:Uncharacterized protein n=1 Tax=Pleurodeles waltl TaxID=8319 RepID=A0AAV7QLH5_PLEWA|nr:hypothetical protein NDU88_007679 [Pleurodeles waltl]